ncbi:MAG: type II secretion system protein [bacterium]|nr:type II secretion system protein [bacterium]
MKTGHKGFTLLELVIVIGILAILGAISVLVLNPAELFAQARDTTRLEDLNTVKNALALYLATENTTDLSFGGTTCNNELTPTCWSSATGVALNCGGRHVGASDADNGRAVDGLGWVPVNLAGMSAGSPLAVLPADPINNATNFYSYACNNATKTFELNAALQSTRYTTTDDRDGQDGGNQAGVYEIGTAPGLSL